MTERIIKGNEFREVMGKGLNELANAVKDTLGPMGNTVIIKKDFGHQITKDGATVANSIELSDEGENLGATLVKNVSRKANDLAGDGTTTATVLAQAIFNNSTQLLDAKMIKSKYQFKKGLETAKNDILAYVKGHSLEAKTEEQDYTTQVALVSSNNDEDIATIITDIYNELGKEAVISAIHGDTTQTTVNIVKGMQFDRGYLSPYCVTDPVRMKAEFKNPLIFLYDGKITAFEQIEPVMKEASIKQLPLIIIADDVQGTALAALMINHSKGALQSSVVLPPGYGKKRVEMLKDMGALFGAVVYDKTMDIKSFSLEDFGKMEKADINATSCAFIGGEGTKENIDIRIEGIKIQIENNADNKYQRDHLEERLGKLTSGVALIKVGANSVEEGKEILDRVEDCKFAVKAALEEGIVEGGGFALYNASMNVTYEPDRKISDFDFGYKVLLDSIKAPINQIFTNAELTFEVIEANLTGKKQGYDVRQGKYVSKMIEAGIVDSYKVIRIALESAVSIVGTLITTNYGIINSNTFKE